jgi:hypothetical protein
LKTTTESEIFAKLPRPRHGHAPTSVNLRLGEILVATGQISEHQLSAALERKRHTGRRIGEELVAAGHLPDKRLAPALRLQRQLMIAACVAALFPMGRGFTGHAEAAQARAQMSVTATVVDSVSIRAVYQAQSLVLTVEDVRRGYVDVPSGSKFEIRNKGPCLFEFRPLADIFSSVKITGPQAVAEFGAAGGSMIHTAGAEGAGQVAVNYRFALARGVSPGAYGWPLALTVLPM